MMTFRVSGSFADAEDCRGYIQEASDVRSKTIVTAGWDLALVSWFFPSRECYAQFWVLWYSDSQNGAAVS